MFQEGGQCVLLLSRPGPGALVLLSLYVVHRTSSCGTIETLRHRVHVCGISHAHGTPDCGADCILQDFYEA